MPWRASLLKEYWLILGRGFKRSIWILMGDALWSCQYQLEIFFHKEDGRRFNRGKWSVFSKSVPVLSEMKQRKDVKGHLIHLFGYFDDYHQILELFSVWGRKKFWHDISLNFSLINWLGWENRKEKGLYLSSMKQKETWLGTGAFWVSIKIPSNLNCFSTPTKGLLYSSGVEQREYDSG